MNVRVCDGPLASVAMLVNVSNSSSLTLLFPIAARTGGVLVVSITLALRGVGFTMKRIEAPPSLNRPWLTLLVCNPNVIPSMSVPSGANNPMASPDFDKLKLA